MADATVDQRLQEPVGLLEVGRARVREPVVAVPVDELDGATTLFEGDFVGGATIPGYPGYDVAPDGRFVMIREAAGAVGAIYAENWFAELLTKVKR